VLRVEGAFAEQGVDRDRVATALAVELGRLAGWLGLERVAVRRKGDLARALASVLR
jgi:uncharacterized protein